MIRRPDDQRFSTFIAHLGALDPVLERFCDKNGFTNVRNAFHAPGRDLRKPGNPHWLICIFLDRNWRDSDVEPNMEHTVKAISDFCPPDSPAVVWRKSQVVAASIPFSDLQSRLEIILEECLQLLAGWSPSSIMASGEKRENLGYIFREYFPGGEKCPD